MEVVRLMKYFQQLEQTTGIKAAKQLKLFQTIENATMFYSTTDYVPINSKKLKAVHQKYNQVIDIWDRDGIISRIDSYQNGIRSKLFRIELKNYTYQDLMEREQVSERPMPRQPKNPRAIPSYRIIKKHLTVDRAGCVAIMDNLKDKLSRPKIKSYNRAIDRIVNNDIQIHLGADTRLRSPFTSFPSVLRKKLKLQGEKLEGIDLKSAQIFFLIANLFIFKKYKEKDVLKFFNLVTRHDIYEYFAEKLKTNREVAKKQVLKALFSHSDHKPKVRQILKREFPTVYNYIMEAARATEKRKNVNNILSSELTKLESTIFINAHLKLYESGVINLTLHDGIYYPKSKRDEVRKAIDKEFRDRGYYGYKLSREDPEGILFPKSN